MLNPQCRVHREVMDKGAIILKLNQVYKNRPRSDIPELKINPSTHIRWYFFWILSDFFFPCTYIKPLRNTLITYLLSSFEFHFSYWFFLFFLLSIYSPMNTETGGGHGVLQQNKLSGPWSPAGPSFQGNIPRVGAIACGHTVGMVTTISLYLPSCLSTYLGL